MGISKTYPDRPGTAILDAVDVHVGGDLHRIVLDGLLPIKGESVLERMHFLRDHADGLRKILLDEPRGGHPSLFADVVVPPSHPDAHAGFIIMERMGYPLLSGTNTMSTAIALLETGRIPMLDGIVPLTLEAPGGLLDVWAECLQGKVESVTYKAQTPSFILAENLSIDVPGYGDVTFDVAWTGAFYPLIDASSVGIDMISSNEEEIVRFSRAFIRAVRPEYQPVHPKFGDEGPLSFVVLTCPLAKEADGFVRTVCCYEYPQNSVCRCPAGVPSTAATAQAFCQGRLQVGDILRTVSIFGSHLQVSIDEPVTYHGSQGIRVSVKGSGWITTRSQILVDFSDPTTPEQGLKALVRPLQAKTEAQGSA